jgi:hypothetical protein
MRQSRGHFSAEHDRARCRDNRAAGVGAPFRRKATDYQRQWRAVHRAGFQGVHSADGRDACSDEPVLPAIGKLERWHGSLKCECVRPAAVFSFDEARCRISSHVDALSPITPQQLRDWYRSDKPSRHDAVHHSTRISEARKIINFVQKFVH